MPWGRGDHGPGRPGRDHPDHDLVAALHAGDEATFARLVKEWSRSMTAVARAFVSTDASAEEVVQDTWLAVITGLDRFEGRAALRTWVYRILVNTAKRRGARESRTLPWSTMVGDGGPAMDPAAFQGPDEPHPAAWRVKPGAWPEQVEVETSVLAGEVRAELGTVIDALPPQQRVVLVMRDVLGHSADDVCELLDITAGNQRVILHRARTAARAGLAAYLAHDEGGER